MPSSTSIAAIEPAAGARNPSRHRRDCSEASIKDREIFGTLSFEHYLLPLIIFYGKKCRNCRIYDFGHWSSISSIWRTDISLEGQKRFQGIVLPTLNFSLVIIRL